MKKLSKLKLKEFQEMSDLEMKNVVGGYTQGGYDQKCGCQFLHNDGIAYFASSMSAAKSAVDSGYATNWCCDSCNQTSWAKKCN